MQAEELVKQGQLDQALEALKNEIRSAPAKTDLRLFLFQLLCVMGQWDRANTQLNVLADMSEEYRLLAKIFRDLILCSQLREEIFAGRRTPVIFGEPEPWIGQMVQVQSLLAEENYAAAEEMILDAFNDAPAISGQIDGQPFEWIADADMRFGPILEVILNAKYYWLPMHRIKSIHIQPPQDLRDLIWLPMELQLANGTTMGGAIFSRYPQTQAADDAVRLGRRTDWVMLSNTLSVGVGQRMFTTNQMDYSLLDVRQIDLDVELTESPQPASASAEADHA